VGWKPHLAHAGETFPNGTMAQDAILHILEHPISTLGETAEVADLLRLFVIDRVSEEALITPTARTPREEQIVQSSKRGREEDDEADPREEDVAESAPTLHRNPPSPLPAWSCGTFAMSPTLHLLLGNQHPHTLPSCYITR